MDIGAFVIYVIGAVIAGWLLSDIWRTLRDSKSVTIPLMVGSGDEGKLVTDVELSQEEAALLIAATTAFVREMEEKYGPLYLPTSTEQAQADAIQDEDEAFDEALASTYK